MSKLLGPLKLDLTLCMFYAFMMMFLPEQLTYMYFGKSVDDFALHMCRCWGTTLFAMAFGMYLGMKKQDESLHRGVLQMRSIAWLGALLSCWYHNDLYTTWMYLQAIVMCSFMTGVTGFYGLF